MNDPEILIRVLTLRISGSVKFLCQFEVLCLTSMLKFDGRS